MLKEVREPAIGRARMGHFEEMQEKKPIYLASIQGKGEEKPRAGQ